MEGEKYSELEVHHIVEAAINRTLLNAKTNEPKESSNWFQNTTSALSIVLTLAGASIYIVLDYGTKITALQENLNYMKDSSSLCSSYKTLMEENIKSKNIILSNLDKKIKDLEADILQLQYEIKGIKK